MKRISSLPGSWAAILLLSVTSAFAQDESSVVGTHWVKFEPVKSGGEVQGCSLAYLTVQADRAYLNGEWVAVNGSIQLATNTGNRLGVLHKIGLKRVIANSPYERPYFSYIQTRSHSTAKVSGNEGDGEGGYKLFSYGLDEAVAGVLKDMMDTGRLTIGYTRKQDGMDVLVPLDLRVADANYNSDGSVSRKRSPDALVAFAECFTSVVGRAKK